MHKNQKYIKAESTSFLKKRTMKKIPLLVVVFVILLSASSFADVDTGFPCSDGCESLDENGYTHYCNYDTGMCFLQQLEVVNESLPPEPAVPSITTEEKVVALEGSLALLQNTLSTLTSSTTLTNQEIAVIKNQLTILEADLAALKSDLSLQTNSVATGLAGLQQGVDAMQETLEQRQSLNRFITTALLVLLVLGVAGGIFYYVARKQKSISPEIVNYITSHIKQGKKLPQIKDGLRKAGWSEEDIDWAYQETVKQNYKQYKGAAPEERKVIAESAVSERAQSTRTAGPSRAYDPKKMISVAVVSILLIVGILFVLRGVTTGKAIQFQKLIGGEEGGKAGEITYKVECTPPHMLNPAGDACCLDVDNSTVCDTTEARQGQGTGGECNDNNQCPRGEYCVESSCRTLASLYTGAGDCSKLCSYYAIKMLTSDGETYSLKPKQGSYTGAGALEWKLLEMPQHCKGGKPLVPINIILKRPGEIISEGVITLQQGEKSEILTHPDIPKLAFALTADTIFETCPK